MKGEKILIFITLGSQKFQFNRLLEAVDRQISDGKITDNVFAQTGASDYMPKHFGFKQFLDWDEYDKWMSAAEIIITHGGTGAIVGALKKQKKVIAIPRLAKYGEHVDDHQLQLIEQFSQSNFIYACTNCDMIWNAIKEARAHSFCCYISNTTKIIQSIEEYLQKCNLGIF